MQLKYHLESYKIHQYHYFKYVFKGFCETKTGQKLKKEGCNHFIECVNKCNSTEKLQIILVGVFLGS